jgi:UDP-3-O-[3-hydroxymyristoyl] glucosamine N-acyltransferase
MKSYSIQEINEVLKEKSLVQPHLVTAPEQLEHQKLKFHLLEIKKKENMGQLKACVAVVNEDILIEPGENKAFIKVNADLAMSQVLRCLHLCPYFGRYSSYCCCRSYCCDG